MSTIVLELYEALRSVGVPDDNAKAAAGALVVESPLNEPVCVPRMTKRQTQR